MFITTDVLILNMVAHETKCPRMVQQSKLKKKSLNNYGQTGKSRLQDWVKNVIGQHFDLGEKQ